MKFSIKFIALVFLLMATIYFSNANPIYELDRDGIPHFKKRIYVDSDSKSMLLDPEKGIAINGVPITGGGTGPIDPVAGIDLVDPAGTKEIVFNVNDGLKFVEKPSGNVNTFGIGGVNLNSTSNISIGTMILTSNGIDALNNGIPAKLNDLETGLIDVEARVTTLEGSSGTSLEPRVTTLETGLSSAEGDITDLGTRVTTLESGSGTSLEPRVTTLETDVTTAKGDITGIDTRLTTTEGGLTSLTDRVTTVESGLSNAEGDITGLDTRVTTVESGLSNAEGDITGLDTRVTTLEGGSGTSLEPRLTALETDVTTAKGDITDLDTRVTTAEGTTTNQGTRLTTAENGITGLDTRVTALESNSGTPLEPRVATLETEVTGLDAGLNGLESGLGDLTTRVTTVESRVSAVEIESGDLVTTVANLDAGLNGLESGLGDLTTRVTTVESRVSAVEIESGDLVTTIANLDTGLNGLESGLGDLTTRVTTVESGLSNAEGDITDLDTRLTTAEGTITSQGTRITALESGGSSTSATYIAPDNGSSVGIQALNGGLSNIIVAKTTGTGPSYVKVGTNGITFHPQGAATTNDATLTNLGAREAERLASAANVNYPSATTRMISFNPTTNVYERLPYGRIYRKDVTLADFAVVDISTNPISIIQTLGTYRNYLIGTGDVLVLNASNLGYGNWYAVGIGSGPNSIVRVSLSNRGPLSANAQVLYTKVFDQIGTTVSPHATLFKLIGSVNNYTYYGSIIFEKIYQDDAAALPI